MKTPQFFIFQGSTPTLTLQLPYALASDDTVYATFSQGGQTVTEYTTGGARISFTPTGTMCIDPDMPSCIRIALSQHDTLLFVPGDCSLQLRVRRASGAVDTLFPVSGAIGKAQKQEVI